MTPKAAFKLVHGLTMHFKTLEYSVLKYGSNTDAAKTAYDKLSENQKHKYNWLSESIPKTQDLVYATIGCIMDDKDIRYESNVEVLDSYYRFKSRREGLLHYITSDITKNEMLGGLNVKQSIQKYLGRHLSPEYVIMRFYETGELKALYESPQYEYCRQKLLNLLKYRDFIPVAKYQHLFQNEEHAV